MTYATLHNLEADIFAQRYYGLNYDELTPFMQAIIDGQIADEYWMYELERAEL